MARYASTKSQLSRLCGISYWRLNNNWHRPGRPKDHGDGSARYDVQQYREWIASWKSAHNFGSRNAEFRYPLNDREQAYADRAKAAAAREKFKLEIEMAEYVPRISANNQIQASNTVVRRELHKALVQELPPRVEMMKAHEIRKVGQAIYDQICARLPNLIMSSVNGNGNGS